MTVILCLKCAVVSAIEWKKRSQKFTFVIIAVWHVWVHFRDIALIYKWCLRAGFATVESFESSHSKCEADLRVAYGKLVIMGLYRVSEVSTHLLFLVTLCAVSLPSPKSSLYDLRSVVHTAKIEMIRACVKWSLTGSWKQWKVEKPLRPKVVAVAKTGDLFTRRGSNWLWLKNRWCFV